MYKHLVHSTVKIEDDGLVIYVDPYMIDKNYNDADYIFITHSHYDHYSMEDIDKVINDNTVLVITSDLEEKVEKYPNEYIVVYPNEEYDLKNISFKTISAYNLNKQFHPKENDWVGYVIYLNGVSYYIAGDTDITEEARKVKADIVFVPVGGTYTMTATEAASLVNEIKPKNVVPIHYGVIVGSKEDATSFKNELNEEITCEII